MCQCRSGEDHRSLTDVLQDLQGQLKGQEPKLIPGQTQSRPLHVVLQVTALAHCVHAPFISPFTCRGLSSLAASELLHLTDQRIKLLGQEGPSQGNFVLLVS